MTKYGMISEEEFMRRKEIIESNWGKMPIAKIAEKIGIHERKLYQWINAIEDRGYKLDIVRGK